MIGKRALGSYPFNKEGKNPVEGIRMNSEHASSKPPIVAIAFLKGRAPSPSIGARKSFGQEGDLVDVKLFWLCGFIDDKTSFLPFSLFKSHIKKSDADEAIDNPNKKGDLYISFWKVDKKVGRK